MREFYRFEELVKGKYISWITPAPEEDPLWITLDGVKYRKLEATEIEYARNNTKWGVSVYGLTCGHNALMPLYEVPCNCPECGKFVQAYIDY